MPAQTVNLYFYLFFKPKMPGSAYIFIYSKNKNAQTLSKQRFLYTPQTQYAQIFVKQ